MKIVLTPTKAKPTGSKSARGVAESGEHKKAAAAAVRGKRVRDDLGKIMTVRILNVSDKAFGTSFGAVFKSNVAKAIASGTDKAAMGKRGVGNKG